MTIAHRRGLEMDGTHRLLLHGWAMYSNLLVCLFGLFFLVLLVIFFMVVRGHGFIVDWTPYNLVVHTNCSGRGDRGAHGETFLRTRARAVCGLSSFDRRSATSSGITDCTANYVTCYSVCQVVIFGYTYNFCSFLWFLVRAILVVKRTRTWDKYFVKRLEARVSTIITLVWSLHVFARGWMNMLFNHWKSRLSNITTPFWSLHVFARG